MIDIKDLYFGIKLQKMSFSSPADWNKLETYNLFDSGRVLLSVAMWVAWDEEERKKHDFLSWCFGDTRARAEYEFLVCSWPYTDEDTIENNSIKVDTYFMYVEPNEKILRDMVDRVSKRSAKKYLAEERRRMKAWRKK